jgi:signal transduction histidine kinase
VNRTFEDKTPIFIPAQDNRFEQANAVRLRLSRLRTLRETDWFEAAAKAAFDRLTRLVQEVLKVPVALITLVEDDRQIFLSQQGLDEPWASQGGTPLSHSFCQYVLPSPEPLAVIDARVHPLLKDNLAIPDLQVIAYLGVPLTLSSGETLGALCAIDNQPHTWDASELRILREMAALTLGELELRLALQEKARLVREREATLQLVAHELTNPLTIQIGMAGLLEMLEPGQIFDEQHADLVSRLGDAGRRMHILLRCLVDAALLEREDLALNRQSFDITALLECIVWGLRTSPDGIRLKTVFPPEAVPLLGDEVRLEQAIRNLLSNAFKYTHSDVELRLIALENEICIQVEDWGPGMTPETLAHILERFVRGSQAAGHPTGLGLGLYVVDQVTRAHHGLLEVTSVVGQGTLFRMRLPRT